jgi:hypothetical protein
LNQPTTWIALAVLVVLAVAGAWLADSFTTGTSFNYRLTATVESGGQMYTGSGVIQVAMHFQEYASPPALPKVTGDAVIVEVPGKAPIFFLLTSDWSVDWDSGIAFLTFQDQLPTPRSVRGDTRFLAGSTASATIPPDRYPLIVAFGDLAKPDSVYEVTADDLSPPLDPGARVVSLTIEMTRDPPTTGAVEAMLPWSRSQSGYLDGDKYHTPGKSFANSLTRLDFSKRGQ